MATFVEHGPLVAVKLFDRILQHPDLQYFAPMNEASGTVYDRCVRNRISGTVNGDPNYGVPVTLRTTARQFTATNSEYFTRADDANFSTGDIDFTIAVWVYLDSKTANMAIIAKRQAAQFEYQLRYESAADRFTFTVSNDGSATVPVTASTLGSPSASTWYFIVCGHDAVNNQIFIQVNAGTRDTAAHTTGVFDSTAAFEIGALQTTSFMNGRIGPWGFWKRVLTTAEVTTLYRGKEWGYAYTQLPASIKPGLVEYCNMDAASGNEAGDHAGLTFTDTNTVTTNPGVIRLEPYHFRGLYLDASGDYVDLGNASAFNFSWYSPFTILWGMCPSITADGAVISKGGTPGWEIYCEPAVGVNLFLRASGGSVRVRSNAMPANGTPTLMSVTVDGTGAAAGVTMYKDGAAYADTDVTDTLAKGVITNSSSVLLGSGDSSARQFRGDLTFIAMFNAVLSAREQYEIGQLADLI